MIPVFTPTLFMPQPAGAATTTFDPSNISAGFTLSNGNLTATDTSGGGADQYCRSINSHTTGKFYCEFTHGSVASGSFSVGAGVAIAAQLSAGGSYLGSSNADGIGCWGITSGTNAIQFKGSGAGSTNLQWSTTNTLLQMAVDIGGQLIWFAVNGGNWNNNASANPATGTDGVSFSGINSGALFAYFDSEINNWFATANFGRSAYAFTPPSGFGNW